MASDLKRETRQQWGAEPPRRRRYVPASVAATGGVAVHWPGSHGSMRDMSHEQHRAMLRAWQAYHKGRGSNDLEYGSLICECGIWMEGRTEFDKPLVRVGSNGTTSANDNFTSVQLMLGWTDLIRDEEKEYLAEAIAWLRDNGWGSKVQPHKFFVGTDCPGPSITDALPEIRRMADDYQEDGMALTDKDIEKVAARINRTLGDYTADGKPRKRKDGSTPPDGDPDAKPEFADQRLREIEKVVRRIERKLS